MSDLENMYQDLFSFSLACRIPVYTSGLFKACVRYFSLFLKDKCISSLVRTNYIEKKFNLVVFSFHCFTNIYSLLGYHALPASLKRLV